MNYDEKERIEKRNAEERGQVRDRKRFAAASLPHDHHADASRHPEVDGDHLEYVVDCEHK